MSVCGWEFGGKCKRTRLDVQIWGVTRCVPRSGPSLVRHFDICGHYPRPGTAHLVHMLHLLFEFFMAPRLRKGAAFLLGVLSTPPPPFHILLPLRHLPQRVSETPRLKAQLRFAGIFLQMPCLRC